MTTDIQTKSYGTSRGELQARIPDAIIFIPGMNHDPDKYPLDEISLLVSDALDNADPVGRARYRVGGVGTERLSKSSETQTATIFREQDGQEVPAVKVYGMSYSSEILTPYRSMPPILKFLFVPACALPLLKTLISWKEENLSSREKLQFLVLNLVLLFLLLYGALLIVTAFSSINMSSLSPVPSAPPASGTPAGASVQANTIAAQRSPAALAPDIWSTVKEWTLAYAARLVLWATLLGLALPNWSQIKESLDNSATMLIAFIRYVWFGQGRPRLRGRLDLLLQDILESPEVSDARIHLLTYSFGSIVAIDTLFRSDQAAYPSYRRIHSLVTIGSPFDVIYKIWPSYFKKRQKIDGLHWINIFAPQDVLSSNFLKRTKAKTVRGAKSKSRAADTSSPCVPGLVPDLNLIYRPTDASDKLGFFDIISFVGLRTHTLYWERGKKSHSNAFDLAVPEMFAEKYVTDEAAG